MKRYAFGLRLAGLALLAALVAGAVYWVGLACEPRPAPVVVLHQRGHPPGSVRDRIESWIPTKPSWAGVWRLEQWILGPRKPINFSGDVIALAGIPGGIMARLAPKGPDLSATSGLQVWLLGDAQLGALRASLKSSSGADWLDGLRISTADGIDCELSTGKCLPLNGSTNQVGLTVTCYPRVRHDSVDLWTSVLLSRATTNPVGPPEGASSLPVISLQTNLNLALRLQVPKGRGIFLLSPGVQDPERRLVGLIIDPL